MIPFNKPFIVGNELDYIRQAVSNGTLSGNGEFTKKSHHWFREHYGFTNCLLTTSCTDALEMAALLIGVKEGDEVIMPSFTFVSTANAFALRGAKVVFVDSRADHPGLDEDKVEALITERTKAIVPVHYAGVACDMDKIMAIAQRHNLFVIEDAAQAIDSYYESGDGTRKPLGSIGHLGAFSFHETKNLISGEGGMLVINDKSFVQRAEILWEKGTNRSAFYRGEVDKYGWVDIGSSFLPSELVAAFLYAQLEHLPEIQRKRLSIWTNYMQGLENVSKNHEVRLPAIPAYASNNAHMFYLLCASGNERNEMIAFMKKQGVQAVFHYQSLHRSQFYSVSNPLPKLPYADFFAEHLVRLPMYYELDDSSQEKIIQAIQRFYRA